MFLSSCGTNYFVYKIIDKLRYNYVEPTISIDHNGVNPYNESAHKKNNFKIANLVDGIIPTSYTYRLAYNDFSNLLDTIPLPINTDKIQFSELNVDGKIIIFHGLNRIGFKGTSYIVDAMEMLKKKYNDDVEIIIKGNMPLNEYLEIMKKTHIVIDQALSYDYGMNALYAMAMGKVVLSGNEIECQEEYKRFDIPVINILPSVIDIYSKLENLILNKKQIQELSIKSRIFVEDFHDYKKIANQYIEEWRNIDERNG
jgi:glycosyltransferase involved in cell wall biosynthesis